MHRIYVYVLFPPCMGIFNLHSTNDSEYTHMDGTHTHTCIEYMCMFNFHPVWVYSISTPPMTALKCPLIDTPAPAVHTRDTPTQKSPIITSKEPYVCGFHFYSTRDCAEVPFDRHACPRGKHTHTQRERERERGREREWALLPL